jgi:FkbM family methyltransferase
MLDKLHSIFEFIARSDWSNAAACLNEYSKGSDSELTYRVLNELIKCKLAYERATKAAALRKLKIQGYYPSVVIDVGAQLGTPDLVNAFPEAKQLWIEPVEEFLPALESLASKFTDAHIIHAAVSDRDGIANLSIADSFAHSSLEHERGSIKRQVKTLKLDTIAKQFSLTEKVLLKIDVDGAELSVLRGSVELLGLSNVAVLIEASVSDQNPRIAPIIQFLDRLGYDISDVIEPLYSQSGRLWQVDLLFLQRSALQWGSRSFNSVD